MKTLIINVGREKEGYSVFTENEKFSGVDRTLQEALQDMRNCIDQYVAMMKEEGKTYPAYLDGGYDFKIKYDME